MVIRYNFTYKNTVVYENCEVIMVATVAAMPHLYKGQKVNFIGGTGTIKSCFPDAGSWSYLVEMEMGPEPDMGRIGYETAILLSQSDLIMQDEGSLSA